MVEETGVINARLNKQIILFEWNVRKNLMLAKIQMENRTDVAIVNN